MKFSFRHYWNKITGTVNNAVSSSVAWMFGTSIDSGRTVINENTIFNLSAVHCAVEVITKLIGTMNLRVYKLEDRDITVYDPEDQRNKILYLTPNPIHSMGMMLIDTMVDVLIRGNGYIQILRNASGRPLQLWPIHAANVEPKLMPTDDGQEPQLVYEINPQSGAKIVVPSRDIIHIRGYGSNKILGQSVLQIARESLEHALDINKRVANGVRMGTAPAGIIETDRMMTEEQIKNTRAQWELLYSGVNNAHRVAILTNGFKYTPVTYSERDVEFLGTRKFQIEEVARWFNVPVVVLKSYPVQSIDLQDIESELMQYCIVNWLHVIETEFTRKLMEPSEYGKKFIQFDKSKMLRGRQIDRYRGHQMAIMTGFKSPNEVRIEEGLPPVPEGDFLLVPINTGINKELTNQPKPDVNPKAKELNQDDGQQ